MRTIAVACLGLAVLGLAGCAAGRQRPGRWEISRKPYKSEYSDVTLLIDTATGATWRYDWDRDAWAPVPRDEQP